MTGPSEQQIVALLLDLPLFQRQPETKFGALVGALQYRHYDVGAHLARAGEIVDGMFVLWSGEVEVFSDATQEDETTQSPVLLRRGDYFCQASKTSPELARANIVATTQVEALLLPNEKGDLFSVCSALLIPPGPPDAPAPVERILDLEKLDVDLFRAHTIPEGNFSPRIFGGQFLGQALAAACASVSPGLTVHSLHSYFVLPGDHKLPVIYEVQRIRDGQSFAVRHVTGRQRGQSVFSMHASFQKMEQGFEHQYPMPVDIPSAEESTSWETLQERYHLDPRLPPKTRRKFAAQRWRGMPIEIRFVDPVDRVVPKKSDPYQLMWFRVRGNLSQSAAEDQAFQRCMAAYASDFSFLHTALLPHGITLWSHTLFMTSLDHSIWFHRPLRIDDWLLYQVESPTSSGSRGFVTGRFYNRAAELVCSVAQEGLVRVTKPRALAPPMDPPSADGPTNSQEGPSSSAQRSGNPSVGNPGSLRNVDNDEEASRRHVEGRPVDRVVRGGSRLMDVRVPPTSRL